MNVRCMIVDDEPLAIEVIENHISKIDSLEVVASCHNAMDAFGLLQKNAIDLLFLDIQMPGMKGTDFIRSLLSPPRVILTTAYREYAAEGFDLDVVDYLVKPISFDRFFTAINKFMRIQSTGANESSTGLDTLSEAHIYLKFKKKIHKIFLNQIQYIESLKDYITIHTDSGRMTVKHTLASFEEMLPSPEFLRIHRSYIVPLKRITGFTSSIVELSGKVLPIGPLYREGVFQALGYDPGNAVP